MHTTLTITLGQYSDKGRKALNQDFHGACIPPEPQASTKGIAVALADGIGSSQVSQVASQFAVAGFLEDYYCTSEAWTVRKSAQLILDASNSWLYAQTRASEFRYDADRGYVCTFSGLVLKGTTAHLFHIGDSRIYRLRGAQLELLTEDHRFRASAEQSYLSRALGMKQHAELDYRTLDVAAGDVFVLTTDGVHEWVSDKLMVSLLQAHAGNLDEAARTLAAAALTRGSNDNLTVQLVRVNSVPAPAVDELARHALHLPLPPPLEPRMQFEGFRLLRDLHRGSRSHVYLAQDIGSGDEVVIKVPAGELREDAAYLERFMLEEWIARRIDNAHVAKPRAAARQRHFLYTVTEFIHGQTLAQWQLDTPRPALAAVRDIIEQTARGLRALHRLEMLHQDLRPQNLMIDANGTVKIIDFGAVRVAGIDETGLHAGPPPLPGTAPLTAPEYLLGETPTTRADQFSLGVVAYQLLSGELPYGVEVAKCKNRSALRRLHYRSVRDYNSEVPEWVDAALRKAVSLDPAQRYEDISEFIHDLRTPNPTLTGSATKPLIERNPLLFWQGLCAALLGVIVYLLIALHGTAG